MLNKEEKLQNSKKPIFLFNSSMSFLQSKCKTHTVGQSSRESYIMNDYHFRHLDVFHSKRKRPDSSSKLLALIRKETVFGAVAGA